MLYTKPGDLVDVFKELGNENSCPGYNFPWLLGKLFLLSELSHHEVEINHRE